MNYNYYLKNKLLSKFDCKCIVFEVVESELYYLVSPVNNK